MASKRQEGMDSKVTKGGYGCRSLGGGWRGDSSNLVCEVKNAIPPTGQGKKEVVSTMQNDWEVVSAKINLLGEAEGES